MVPMGEPLDYSHRDELWIDYVADVADGFNATMTVASTLARPQADLLTPDDVSFSTKRGDILVMGGDQVYPSADYRTYRNRLIGPYRSALPAVKGEPPELFAIPGNHDWYDGLTAFLRVFCQGETIGGWQTRQRRSYFALQLPHRWWLWGIDIQFESYLDTSQLAYFRDVIGPQLTKGDSIILCSATPSWIEANAGEPDAFENIDLLHREIAAPRGAAIRLVVAGDKHHYARYAAEEGDKQLITAGGGGAYLAGTHHLPKQLEVPPGESTDLEKSPPTAYHLAKAYPSRATSRRLRVGVLRLPFQNGSFWGLLGFFYLVIGWSVILGLRLADEGFATQLRTMKWGELVEGLLGPAGLVMMIVLVAGLAGFTKSSNPVKRWGLGASHAAAHLILILTTIWAAARILQDLSDGFLLLGVTLVLGGVGSLLGSWLVAIYLLIADRFHCNTNELFAAQHIDGYNNFLRFHISKDGSMTLHPVQIRKAAHWQFSPEGDMYAPWFVPAGDPPQPRLIEEPIRFMPLDP